MEAAQMDRPVGDVLIVRGFLPPVECESWIAQAERLGFRQGPNPQAAVSTVRERAIRSLATLVDGRAARSLFARVRQLLPDHGAPSWLDHLPEGCHPRIRIYRDEPADAVPIHQDDASASLNGITTGYTLKIFLNECDGGWIRFHRDPSGSSPFAEFPPEAGTVMIFPHATWHEPAPVLAGRRYLLRADLLHRDG